jgi:hypothetical protein
MELEVGKYYKTRVGYKAKITSICISSPECIQAGGLVFLGKREDMYAWDLNGNMFKNIATALDLIELWDEYESSKMAECLPLDED